MVSCYLESFSKVLKVVLLLWFGVFYPFLEFFSFEVSLVMTFLVSFSFTCCFIFVFSISFGGWGVLVKMLNGLFGLTQSWPVFGKISMICA